MILASLFQNGAVLQRDKAIPVWGKSAANVEIVAVLNGVEAHSRTSSCGDFILYFPPMSVGGPFELTVSAPEANESITLKDILIGEVWLASGQSNMDYTLSTDWRVDTSVPSSQTIGRKQESQFHEMLDANGQFRFFVVEQCASGAPERFCRGHWEEVTEFSCGGFSAAGAWFGLGLQLQLGIPVGIIQATWGGTTAEVWMSYEALASLPEGAALAAGKRQNHWGNFSWAKNTFGLNQMIKNEPQSSAYAAKDLDDSSWTLLDSGSWIKQKLAGCGSVWWRKTIELPADWANQELMLCGGCVDKHDITYFNGVEIGRMGKDFDVQYWNVSRRYRIPAELAVPGKCVLAIRASAFLPDGAVYGSWYLVNPASGESMELEFPWRGKVESDLGAVQGAASDVVTIPGNNRIPSILYDGMIRPLIPYALRGVIWYQGESNAEKVDQAVAYRDIMQALIDSWRMSWGEPDLKFIMVQIAGFREKQNFEADSAWAHLRESQRVIAAADPGCFMVTAVDLGEENDIHPQNKMGVGKRLAMSALYHVYACSECTPSGPEIVGGKVVDSEVILTFNYADEMKFTSEEKSFFLADHSGKFFPADKVEVRDDQLVVASSQVPEPVMLRYAWADFPHLILVNAAGEPAAPFQLELTGKSIQ